MATITTQSGHLSYPKDLALSLSGFRIKALYNSDYGLESLPMKKATSFESGKIARTTSRSKNLANIGTSGAIIGSDFFNKEVIVWVRIHSDKSHWALDHHQRVPSPFLILAAPGYVE